MPLGMEVGVSPGDFVSERDPAPLPKKEAEPGGGASQFSAHVCCGQTAGLIKMALGMEVGLGPVHIVLDGHTAPLPKKGGRAPLQFSAHCWATVCKTVRPVLSVRCLSVCLSVCLPVCLSCPVCV